MGYLFDGPNKRVVLTAGTTTFEATDLYSRWKDWMLLSDNSKYAHAFTSVGGEAIGAGQSVAPYIFLNTTDGWRIRPQEADHELRVVGNLYSSDPTKPIFVSTLGDYAVIATVERSSAAIAVATGGGGGGGGLTSTQATQLLELHRIMGLDAARPLVVTMPPSGAGTRAAGAEIQQTVTPAGNSTTVQRT